MRRRNKLSSQSGARLQIAIGDFIRAEMPYLARALDTVPVEEGFVQTVEGLALDVMVTASVQLKAA